MNPVNPFEYGRELSLSELVDREDELSDIQATIRNHGKLFLIGPRRFGKTSLLSAAGENAKKKGAAVLRFDAEKFESLEVLAASLLTEAGRMIQDRMERMIEQLRKHAARLRPSATVGHDGSISVSLGVTAAERGQLALLTDALDAIESMAAESQKQVAVIIDEVQHIVIEHGREAELQLRSTIQRHREVGYIFAGSDTRLLTSMTTDPNRPFFRLGSITFLGPIPREAFLPFLEKGFRNSGFSVENGACAHILDRAEDVPYNVQRLAHEAWEMLRSSESETLTAALVDATLKRIVRREDPAYTQLWTSLTRNQKLALKAVIETGGNSLLSGDVTQAYALPASSMKSALEGLSGAHVLRTITDNGRLRYRLVDPFMAAWLEDVQ